MNAKNTHTLEFLKERLQDAITDIDWYLTMDDDQMEVIENEMTYRLEKIAQHFDAMKD